MKHRKLIATIAAGAALSVHDAMEIAHREMNRRGLTATHQVSALYAGVDRQAEGAAFAMIVCPLARTRASAPQRLKLLIHDDGHTALQPIPARTRAHA